MFNNQLSGRIPREIGALPLLSDMVLSNNKLTGSFPEEMGSIGSLKFLTLKANMLTGSIPDIFDNFTMIQRIDLSSNRLTGSIPASFGNLKMRPNPRGGVFLQDNDIRGLLPSGYCSNVEKGIDIRIDGAEWFLDEAKVTCTCCKNAACHMWNTREAPMACPSSNILDLNFYYQYSLSDRVADIDILERIGADLFQRDICLSPTGCYTIGYYNSAVRSPTTFSNSNYSYSVLSNSLVANHDECDAVEVCGTVFDARNPKRKALNHLTQLVVPDLTILNDPSLPEYKALCWIMTEDPLFDDFEICDGTLLQRYVLAFFYFLQEAFKFDDFSSHHTCDWPGVSCDLRHNFVEHLILPDSHLTGSLITEIGLLKRLHTIDLSGNTLTGTIDPSIFGHMPNLEVVHIGVNQFGGDIPDELLILPQIKEVNISNNVIVGTLPNHISYSESLGEYLLLVLYLNKQCMDFHISCLTNYNLLYL